MKTVLGYPVKELFDPVQTHAVYSVPLDRVDEVKQRLRELGAIRFRVVKTRALGSVIVCFKTKKVTR